MSKNRAKRTWYARRPLAVAAQHWFDGLYGGTVLLGAPPKKGEAPHVKTFTKEFMMVSGETCRGFIRLSDRRIGGYLESRAEMNEDLPKLLFPTSLTAIESVSKDIRRFLPRAEFGSAERPVTMKDIDSVCGCMLPRTAPLDMRGPLVDSDDDDEGEGE